MQQPELDRVHVLEFINREPPITLVHLRGDIRPIGKHADGEQEHILEIDCRPLLFDVLIGTPHIRNDMR